jgi:Fic family protein
MFVHKEAVLSSQIEGTQASLDDVLEFEAGATSADRPGDVAEAVNYIAAMNCGLQLIKEPHLETRTDEGTLSVWSVSRPKPARGRCQ